jgi:heme/copper-type cytochrome/quinol oxidase subunit 4
MRHAKYRPVFIKFLLTIILTPIAVLVFEGFIGRTVQEAFQNSISYVFLR